MSFSLLDPERADLMLREIGGASLTADWGARLLARGHRLYDPLHYNNGAAWPFMTGFVALAHYRYHRAWAGWDLVRDIARTTFDYALGRNPELMSGAFYRTLDTAVPQQFFGTSMMASAMVRGLLGLEADAPHRSVAIEPHLPAEWDSVAIESFRIGQSTLGMSLVRSGSAYQIDLRHRGEGTLQVRLSPALPLGARVQRVTVQGRDVPLQVEQTPHDVHPVIELALEDEVQVEIEYTGGVEVLAPAEDIQVGDAAESLRILDFSQDGGEYVLLVEGLSGRSYDVLLRAPRAAQSVQRATVIPSPGGYLGLRVDIPAGQAEYGRVEVRFRD
jgi:hypothetical protein